MNKKTFFFFGLGKDSFLRETTASVIKRPMSGTVSQNEPVDRVRSPLTRPVKQPRRALDMCRFFQHWSGTFSSLYAFTGMCSSSPVKTTQGSGSLLHNAMVCKFETVGGCCPHRVRLTCGKNLIIFRRDSFSTVLRLTRAGAVTVVLIKQPF